MTIKVKLFAILKDRAGKGELALELDSRSTVADAVAQLQQMHPAIIEYTRKSAVAVNCEYVARDTLLHAGDELALIPPVSGG